MRRAIHGTYFTTLVALGAVSAPALAGDIFTLEDGDWRFSGSPSWFEDAYATDEAETGWGFFIVQNTGNPGATANLSLWADAALDGQTNAIVNTFVRGGPGTTYRLNQLGTIPIISVAVETRSETDLAFPMGLHVVIQQGGVDYISVASTEISGSTEWRDNLVQFAVDDSSFVRADGQAGQLDLSESGATLQLGFGISLSNDSQTDLNTAFYFDNFLVTVSVPSLPGAGVLALAGALCVRRRRG